MNAQILTPTKDELILASLIAVAGVAASHLLAGRPEIAHPGVQGVWASVKADPVAGAGLMFAWSLIGVKALPFVQILLGGGGTQARY
jgi:hypothetical protein